VSGLIGSRIVEDYFIVTPFNEMPKIGTDRGWSFAVPEMVPGTHQTIISKAAAFFEIIVPFPIVIEIGEPAKHVPALMRESTDAEIQAVPSKTLEGVIAGPVVPEPHLLDIIVRPEFPVILGSSGIHETDGIYNAFLS
jgi:hypothetical protein